MSAAMREPDKMCSRFVAEEKFVRFVNDYPEHKLVSYTDIPTPVTSSWIWYESTTRVYLHVDCVCAPSGAISRPFYDACMNLKSLPRLRELYVYEHDHIPNARTDDMLAIGARIIGVDSVIYVVHDGDYDPKSFDHRLYVASVYVTNTKSHHLCMHLHSTSIALYEDARQEKKKLNAAPAVRALIKECVRGFYKAILATLQESRLTQLVDELWTALFSSDQSDKEIQEGLFDTLCTEGLRESRIQIAPISDERAPVFPIVFDLVVKLLAIRNEYRAPLKGRLGYANTLLNKTAGNGDFSFQYAIQIIRDYVTTNPDELEFSLWMMTKLDNYWYKELRSYELDECTRVSTERTSRMLLEMNTMLLKMAIKNCKTSILPYRFHDAPEWYWNQPEPPAFKKTYYEECEKTRQWFTDNMSVILDTLSVNTNELTLFEELDDIVDDPERIELICSDGKSMTLAKNFPISFADAKTCTEQCVHTHSEDKSVITTVHIPFTEHTIDVLFYEGMMKSSVKVFSVIEMCEALMAAKFFKNRIAYIRIRDYLVEKMFMRDRSS